MGLLSLLKACGVHHLKRILLGVSPHSPAYLKGNQLVHITSHFIARDLHDLVGCHLGGNIRLYFYSHYGQLFGQ